MYRGTSCIIEDVKLMFTGAPPLAKVSPPGIRDQMGHQVIEPTRIHPVGSLLDFRTPKWEGHKLLANSACHQMRHPPFEYLKFAPGIMAVSPLLKLSFFVSLTN